MNFKTFVKIAEVAKDNGYRECYIKKINAQFLFKKNIYFNMSGIYRYEKGRFVVVCDFEKVKKETAENICKLLGFEFKETKA
ncbi:MAG: hypothetical protein II669_05550 [Elusimicrobia bacterium]|jgi:ADP-dependent phosphofructokinase/glucokinase|nr:hypothetical protein [Elusimicrobiota bacterium]